MRTEAKANCCMGRDGDHGAGGFTLIELMIVLVIMGFMLAMVGPRVAKSLGGLSLKTTAKKVAGALRYARSKAVNTSRTYNVIFDSEKNRVIVLPSPRSTVSEMMGSDNATDDETVGDEETTEQPASKKPEQEIRIFPLPEGVTFNKISIEGATTSDQEQDEGIFQMAFFPNGTSQTVEIILADRRERMFIIDVDFMTGVVSVAEETEE